MQFDTDDLCLITRGEADDLCLIIGGEADDLCLNTGGEADDLCLILCATSDTDSGFLIQIQTYHPIGHIIQWDISSNLIQGHAI